MEELTNAWELNRARKGRTKEGEGTFLVEKDDHLRTPLAKRARRPITTQEREKAKQLAQMLKTEKPSFMVVMQPSYLIKGLNVPLQFAREHFREGAHNVTLQLPNGRTWFVQLCFHNRKIKALLSGGWNTFVRENMLEDGDCCVFELLKVDEIAFKVSIVRVVEEVVVLGSSGEDTFCVKQDEYLSMSFAKRGRPPVTRQKRKRGRLPVTRQERKGGRPPITRQERKKRSPVTTQEREKAKHSAQLSTEKPSFMVVMQPSYLIKGLNVPLLFAREHFMEGAHNVTLQLPNGRTWCVQLCFRNSKIKALLSGGWRRFVQENMLEDGDCCVFELLKVDEIVLKVSIFRVVEDVVLHGSSESLVESHGESNLLNIEPVLERKKRGSGVRSSSGRRPASTCEIRSTDGSRWLRRSKRMKNKDQKEIEEMPYVCDLNQAKRGRRKEGEDNFLVKHDEHISRPITKKTRRPTTTKERDGAICFPQQLKTVKPSMLKGIFHPGSSVIDLICKIKYYWQKKQAQKMVDPDRYGYLDMVYDIYNTVIREVPVGHTTKFKVRCILPTKEEIEVMDDATVYRLFSLHMGADSIKVYVYDLEVNNEVVEDYTINGFPKALVDREE